MNHITITGRLASDPTRRETKKGVVCSFRLASGKAGDRGGRVWIDVDTWGNLAGVCYQHLAKGRQVIVSGHLVQPQWVKRDTGEKRESYVVVADGVEFTSETLTPQGQSKR